MISFEKYELGKTGMYSPRLGVGTAYGLRAKDIVWAVENGINYIFWGSYKLPTVPKALKMLGPAKREKVILAVPCYGYKFFKKPKPKLISSSLKIALRRLRTDYVDIFQLGWLSSKPSDENIEQLLELKNKGLVKHIGITTHSRKLAAELMKDGTSVFEVFNIRYNAANRGAEKDIFPYFDKERHVIVNFTATRWGQLLKKPYSWPDDKYHPTAVDCYRFVLSRPEVNVCLTGAKNRKELKENLTCLELGPMSEEELLKIKEFGDFIYASKNHLMEKK